MKFDQLAIYCRHKNIQDDIAKHWKVDVEDYVTAIGFNNMGHLINNTARLLFDHTSWPMEFELLHYIGGWNWLADYEGDKMDGLRLSHFGVHLDSREEMDSWRDKYEVLQEVVTVKHTNAGAQDRRYHYMILKARENFGGTVKLIRRLTVDEGNALLQEFMLKWSQESGHRIG